MLSPRCADAALALINGNAHVIVTRCDAAGII